MIIILYAAHQRLVKRLMMNSAYEYALFLLLQSPALMCCSVPNHNAMVEKPGHVAMLPFTAS